DGEAPQRGDLVARDAAGGEEVEEGGQLAADRLEPGGGGAPLLGGGARERALVLRRVELLVEPPEGEGGVALEPPARLAACAALAAAQEHRVGGAAIPAGARRIDGDGEAVGRHAHARVRHGRRGRAPAPHLQRVAGQGRRIDRAVEHHGGGRGRRPAV